METRATAPEPSGQATGDRFAALLGEFRRRLDDELASWIGARRRTTAAALPEAVELVDAVAELVGGGGKRLRPALVWFSHAAAGGERPEAVWPVALATELLHSYLLIHDDIMDHAEVRRGLPAAHVSFARRARREGWAAGDDFGRSAAILAGDLAHTWAVELFARGRGRVADADAREELDRCFSAMCEEVIGGQYLELLVARRRTATEPELARVLQLKSGRYTVERPLQLGALVAGASPPVREVLGAYGRAVGEAFQLQDDVLGMFGDPETVGKPVGGDLAEGKFTYLVHHALTLAGPEGSARLRAALGGTGLGPGEVAAAQAVIRDSGALARVETMIEERLTEAARALDRLAGLDPAADGFDFLAGLVEALGERRR